MEETGYNAFELRMYDPVIGRWTTTDPKGQYPSPYVGMGNDWANKTDPTGGEDDWHFEGGKLVADKDDNAYKLSQFLNIDESYAISIFHNSRNWDNGVFAGKTSSFDDIAGHTLNFKIATVNWENSGIEKNFTQQGTDDGCYDYSCQNLISIGITPIKGYWAGFEIANKVNDEFFKSNNYNKGMMHLNTQLLNGNPVIVGVAHGYLNIFTQKYPNQKDVNHYVIITDLTVNSSGASYTYFDGANPHVFGTKFTFNLNKNGILSSNQTFYQSPDFVYNVTWIGKNK